MFSQIKCYTVFGSHDLMNVTKIHQLASIETMSVCKIMYKLISCVISLNLFNSLIWTEDEG